MVGGLEEGMGMAIHIGSHGNADLYAMLRRALVLTLLMGGLLLLAAAAVVWRGEREAGSMERGSTYAFSEEEVQLLCDGDFILRRGYGYVSDMIGRFLDEDHRLTHCGVVVEREDGFWVVHAVSNNVSEVDGMQAHRLADFVRQSQPGSIVVTRFRAPDDRHGLSRRAVDHLRRQVPFDHHFDLADTATIYCSELLWRIVRDEYGVDVFQQAKDAERRYFGFANFLDPRWFEVVLDHHQ